MPQEAWRTFNHPLPPRHLRLFGCFQIFSVSATSATSCERFECIPVKGIAYVSYVPYVAKSPEPELRGNLTVPVSRFSDFPIFR